VGWWCNGLACQVSWFASPPSPLPAHQLPLPLLSLCPAPHCVCLQVVVGTLMNICDNPNRVSVGQDWVEGERLRRIPIIVTGGPLVVLTVGWLCG
jgi:hypothetical protein